MNKVGFVKLSRACLGICFSVLVLFQSLCVSAQERSDLPEYLKSYISDTRAISASPLKWENRDIENLVIAAGGTAFLMVYDEQLTGFVFRNKNSAIGNVSNYLITPFGNGIYTLPLLGVVYLCGSASNDYYERKMALLGLKTFVITAGEATLVKMMFQRDRPGTDGIDDAWNFKGPFAGFSDDGSFISRHAAVSFSVAAIFAEGYREQKKWVPWVSYSLASMVTVLRVYDRRHWASDAFAGACLGIFTGKFMYKINNNLNKSKRRNTRLIN